MALTVGQFLPAQRAPVPAADPQRSPFISQQRALTSVNSAGAGDVAAQLQGVDDNIKRMMKSIDVDGKYADFASGPGTQAWNPELYAKSVSRLGAQLGKNGLAIFAATQLGLFLLNRHGRIWNPLTIAPIPIVQNFIPAALDVLTGTPQILTGFDDSSGGFDFYSKNHGPDADDIHLSLAKGNYNELRIVHYPPFVELVVRGGSSGPFQRGLGSHLGANSQLASLVDDPFGTNDSSKTTLLDVALDTRNKYTPDRQYDQHATFPVDSLVRDVLSLGPSTKHMGADPHTDLLTYHFHATDKQQNSPTLSKIGSVAKSLFGRRNPNTGEQRPDINEVRDSGQLVFTQLANSAFTHGVIPSKLKGETSHGYVITQAGRSPTDIIPDDVAYVPLSFTDLRPISNSYRTVYFRPFIKSLTENFSPQWNKGQYFGRADAVATYEATGRSVNLSFQVVAFGPEDLKNIYQKLSWMASMVYPEYDKNLLFVSGPVVRMRVGDVINALGPEGTRGLPGIIESLDFDYSAALWELEAGFKVPRNIDVSMTFTVLHDRPIGRGAEGKFGGIGTIKDGKYFPPGLENNKSAGSQDTEKLPDILDNGDSFRSIKGIPMNDYTTFKDSDKEQK